jgi:hypothetical protein
MLRRLFARTVLGAFALLAGALPAYAQNGAVTGQVVSGESGMPLANTAIFLEGTGYGAVANAEGRFTIQPA